MSLSILKRLLVFCFLSTVLSVGLPASVSYIYNEQEYKLTEQNFKGVKYVELTKVLKPLKIKPVYNRVLHKISFTFNNNTFILSPVSSAVSVNGVVELFNKPVVINQGVIYVSTPAFIYISPKLFYDVSRSVIIVDAGHGGGGEDGRGAEAELNGKKIYEKEITLKFANILGPELKKLGYDVKYTRTQDKKIDLKKRADFANENKGKVFISIHANSSADAGIKGADVFYMSEEAEDAYSSNVAKAESGDKDVEEILKSMTTSAHIKDSSALAAEVSAKLQNDVTNRGVKKAPFAVLSGTEMPSVLLELGFMTNPDDLKRLTTDADLKNLAAKVAAGVDAFIGAYK